MEYFAGLDVSLETVNVCIVNAAGDILLEKKIAAEPAAIVHLLNSFGSPFKRIGCRFPVRFDPGFPLRTDPA